MNKLVVAGSLLALTLSVTLTSPARAADNAAKSVDTAPHGAPKIDADREKRELRLVEILKIMQQTPPPPPAEQKSLGDEYTQLLFSFAGIDLKNPPKDPQEAAKAQQRAMEAQAEILARRDPALLEVMQRSFKQYQCKSKQTEAKANLRSLATAERAYQAEHDAFSKDLKAIDAVLDSKRYQVVVVDANPKHFRARATGLAEMAGDVWEVDEAGTPKAVTDLCAK